jgi:dynein heavy chain 2, cytosolic
MLHSVFRSTLIPRTPLQIEKALQLNVACEQRMGVILMGPSGSGKTTLWQLLAEAYTFLGCRPIVYKLNPKAMPRRQLLGSMDVHTRCASFQCTCA